MKTYIFKSTTNNTSNNPTKSNSAQNIMNKELAEKILNFAPYLNKNTPKKEKKTIEIPITFDFYGKTTIPSFFNKHTMSFDEACKIILGYKNNMIEKDIYDFELPDGTPVRIFDDEIQIGYDLFDLNNLFYEATEPKKKQIIIDLAIKIKK